MFRDVFIQGDRERLAAAERLYDAMYGGHPDDEPNESADSGEDEEE